MWPNLNANPISYDAGGEAQDDTPYNQLPKNDQQLLDALMRWCQQYEKLGKDMDEPKDQDGKEVSKDNLYYKTNFDMYKGLCVTEIYDEATQKLIAEDDKRREEQLKQATT